MGWGRALHRWRKWRIFYSEVVLPTPGLPLSREACFALHLLQQLQQLQQLSTAPQEQQSRPATQCQLLPMADAKTRSAWRPWQLTDKSLLNLVRQLEPTRVDLILTSGPAKVEHQGDVARAVSLSTRAGAAKITSTGALAAAEAAVFSEGSLGAAKIVLGTLSFPPPVRLAKHVELRRAYSRVPFSWRNPLCYSLCQAVGTRD